MYISWPWFSIGHTSLLYLYFSLCIPWTKANIFILLRECQGPCHSFGWIQELMMEIQLTTTGDETRWDRKTTQNHTNHTKSTRNDIVSLPYMVVTIHSCQLWTLGARRPTGASASTSHWGCSTGWEFLGWSFLGPPQRKCMQETKIAGTCHFFWNQQIARRATQK